METTNDKDTLQNQGYEAYGNRVRGDQNPYYKDTYEHRQWDKGSMARHNINTSRKAQR